jgi:redox-sensitive bicupin YhaK (pirin superfamily)
MSTFETVHEPLEARDVLLGRTTHVRRLVPNRHRRMIGAWCFLDHYGPDDIKKTGGMWVPPHPHTGLHTDSLGSEQLIRPGQLNVMTAAHGICHAEVSPETAPTFLHGVQLWVCLPDEVRESTPPAFVHLADLPTSDESGVRVRVLMGSLGGEASKAPSFSPLVGAEITLAPGASTTLPLDREFEYGALTVTGSVDVGGAEIPRRSMAYLGQGRHELALSTSPGVDGASTVLLLGGAPFDEEIVMWWNFIGRSHEEIVAQREAWNGSGVDDVPDRYGRVAGFDGDRLLAPPMPNTRLKARGRAG